jgi:predicted lipoprotein with Yx(FWY)xxD motif
MKGISTIFAVALSAVVLASIATGSSSAPTVKTRHNANLGTIVISATGRTLYHYLPERGKKVACTGACAKLWPPDLISKSAKPVAGAGIKASKLGTIVRPDGTVQVTYYGLPLYRYSGDTRNGQVNGQGVESSWYAIAPSGAVIKLSATPQASTGGGSSSGSSTSSSGGGGYGY